MNEWERRTTFKIYSQPSGDHMGNARDDRGNALTIDIDVWTKRRYIIDVYRRQLRATIASRQAEYPMLSWMRLFRIWRGQVRSDVFNLLFAAHLARDIKFSPNIPGVGATA